MAYFIHLSTAFLISSFFHILGLFVVSHGYVSTRSLILDMGLFFMAQPSATLVEALVIRHCQAYVLNIAPSNTEANSLGPWSSKTNPRVLHILGYTLGYFWVISWFTFTGWWFVKDYIAIGVLEWSVPFSFCKVSGLEALIQSKF